MAPMGKPRLASTALAAPAQKPMRQEGEKEQPAKKGRPAKSPIVASASPQVDTQDAVKPAARPKKPCATESRVEVKAPSTMMTFEEWKKLQEPDEQWPVPAYMEARGSTKFKEETFLIVTRWQAETKIQYRPHAKRPGSKSHIRYEEYSKATTVGEALAFGTYPVDWCWDYEKGFLKVLGNVRDEPLDTSKVTDDSTLSDVDKAIEFWHRRELARNLGLDYKDLSVGKGGGESVVMRAHRLVAQRGAKQRLEAAVREGRKITAEEVRLTLQEWGFAKNITRVNVTPDGQDFVFSDTMGLLRDRVGDIHTTSSTKTYPEVVQLLNKYLSDRLPADMAAFKWTSLNLNCNYAAKLHRDGNNFGPSFLAAFGDFEGGQLNAWPEDDRHADKLEDLKDEDKVQFDMNKGLVLFNGNCGHSVEAFTGHRFSLVYFTIRCYEKAPEGAKQELRSLGMNYPLPMEDRTALLRAPKGYGGMSKRKAEAKPEEEKGLPPAVRFLPFEQLHAGKQDATTPQKKEAKKRGRPAKEQPAKETPTPDKEQAAKKRGRPAKSPIVASAPLQVDAQEVVTPKAVSSKRSRVST